MKINLILLIGMCVFQTFNQNLAPQPFKAQFKKTSDAVLLNVRTSPEIFFGVIKLSEDLQEIDYYDDDFEAQIQKLDKNKIYFVYCRTGIRSQKAIKIMQKNGLKKLINLKGGYKAWTETYDE